MAAPDKSVLLSIRDVSKVYRMGEVDVSALRHVTLDIADGEFLVVAGPSGSGKSTLLYLLGGMDRPTSGSILFQGGDACQHSAQVAIQCGLVGSESQRSHGRGSIVTDAWQRAKLVNR